MFVGYGIEYVLFDSVPPSRMGDRQIFDDYDEALDTCEKLARESGWGTVKMQDDAAIIFNGLGKVVAAYIPVQLIRGRKGVS